MAVKQYRLSSDMIHSIESCGIKLNYCQELLNKRDLELLTPEIDHYINKIKEKFGKILSDDQIELLSFVLIELDIGNKYIRSQLLDAKNPVYKEYYGGSSKLLDLIEQLKEKKSEITKITITTDSQESPYSFLVKGKLFIEDFKYLLNYKKDDLQIWAIFEQSKHLSKEQKENASNTAFQNFKKAVALSINKLLSQLLKDTSISISKRKILGGYCLYLSGIIKGPSSNSLYSNVDEYFLANFNRSCDYPKQQN